MKGKENNLNIEITKRKYVLILYALFKFCVFLIEQNLITFLFNGHIRTFHIPFDFIIVVSFASQNMKTNL